MATAVCARGSAFVSLALAMMSLVRADVFPHPWTIKQWAGRLDRELERVVRQASGVDQLKQLYTEHKHLFEVRRNDAQHLVESVTGEIEKVLDKKVKALEHLGDPSSSFSVRLLMWMQSNTKYNFTFRWSSQITASGAA